METDSAFLGGLTSGEADTRLAEEGRNELPKEKKNLAIEWARRLIAPIPLMLIGAAAFSFVLGKNFDGWFILILLVANLGVSAWHEWKASHTLELLEERIATSARVLRDGAWTDIDSRVLVWGDVVELVPGSVVPADAEVLEANAASANESVVTGESLPVDKKKGDALLTGSFIAGGIVRARITATGARTRYGKTIAKDIGPRRPSALERDILSISRFLSGVSVGIAAVLSVALLFSGQNLFEVIRFDLTLLIAGIPVALPVVMSLIISFGILELSRRSAIVRRIAALEDLANVNIFLSDKTGTLTKNEIQVHAVELLGEYDEGAAASYAAAAESNSEHYILEKAVVGYAEALRAPSYTVVDFIPADSVRKRSTALVKTKDGFALVALGAPQVIQDLSAMDAPTRARFDAALEDAAHRGFRVLALAVREGKGTARPAEKDMQMAALFLLSDELRDDAKDVVAFLEDHGVAVKMLTGDNIAISREIAANLGIEGDAITAHDGNIGKLSEEDFERTGVFSGILPEDKKTLVDIAERHHTVAVTGDGINDLPALKSADVGIAVENAVDALKDAADIALTESGIGVVKDAVIEARKIFARIYSYSIYRISESFRLIITVAFFGIVILLPILTPLQLIILALLNDLPIISLAFNRVKVSQKPTAVNVKKRFILSLLYGTVGIVNSVLFFVVAEYGFHLPWGVIQTLFFLKLTVSGHMLVYVAHTAERWWRFLPSAPVIEATAGTQIVATALAAFGIFMAAAPWPYIAFVWLWALLWMQVTDAMKQIHRRFNGRSFGAPRKVEAHV